MPLDPIARQTLSAARPPAAPAAPAPAAAQPTFEADKATFSGAAAAPADAGRPTVARIDQMHPSGEEAGYANGFSNCGPTSMAMVARAFGRGGTLTDAALITKMAQLGGTTKDGSSPASIVKMARGVGLQAEVHGPKPDLAWIKGQLDAGRLVIAHGDYFALPPHGQEPRTWKGGHFLVVAGQAANGDFLLRDPLDAKVAQVKPADLARFIGAHPSGGHQIAIGPATASAKP